jgi:hypothetical protein
MENHQVRARQLESHPAAVRDLAGDIRPRGDHTADPPMIFCQAAGELRPEHDIPPNAVGAHESHGSKPTTSSGHGLLLTLADGTTTRP